MLREAGLLSDNGRIIPAVLTERLIAVFANSTASDVRFFPTTESMAPRGGR
jgi:hypothetical protein